MHPRDPSEFLRKFLELLPFPAVLSRPDGREARCNTPFTLLFSLDGQPDPARDWLEVLVPPGPALQETRDRQNRNARPSGEAYGWDLKVRAADGPQSRFTAYCLPLDRELVLHLLEETSPALIAQHSLALRLRYEKALNALAHTLLQGMEPGQALNRALQELVEATGVCRVYVYRNREDEKLGLCYTPLAEAVRPGVAGIMPGELNQCLAYGDRIPRWREVMSQGGRISGLVEEFPPTERAILGAQDIQQILVLPLYLNQQWSGFMGFDDTTGRRRWSAADKEALHTAASIVGAYLWQQEAQAKLALNEQRFRHVVEHAIEGIFIIQNQVIKFVNPFGCLILEASENQIVGSGMDRFNHPDDRALMAERFKRRMAGEPVSQAVEHRIVTLGGHLKWVEAYGTLATWEGCQADMVFVRDITEAKAAAEERLAREKLLSAVQLAGAVCHELNQPLQVIRAKAELLLLDPLLDPGISRQLEGIMEETDRMGDITRRLGNLTRLETKKYLGDHRILDLERSSGN